MTGRIAAPPSGWQIDRRMSVANAAVLCLWGLVAASVIVRLSRRGAAVFGERLDTGEHRLAGTAAFYLAVPALVLVSQLAQVLAMYALGAELGRFESWVYFGIVEPSVTLAPLTRAAIAAIAPLSLLAFAAGAIVWTRARPATATRNHLRLEIARVLLLLAFGVQPIVSLLSRQGDFAIIREALDERHPQSGGLALLAYGVLAAWAFWRWRRASALRLLASPVHDAARLARSRLATSPDDADALRALGAAQLASGDARAVETLAAALAQAPDDPRVALLLGRAHLEAGHPHAASERLRQAGQELEAHGSDDELLLEITLALSAARIAIGDPEGAILTAEAACERAPRDPRALLMAADALVAGQRRSEARMRLEDALARASGALKGEIARRLEALERR